MNLVRRDQRLGELRLVELVPRALAVPPAPLARYKVHAGELTVEVDEHFDSEVLTRLLTVVAGC